MRNIAPPILIAALLVAISIAMAAVAATIAVARPARAELDADLQSRLSADYSAGFETERFGPLDPRVVDIARNDERGLISDPDAEIVQVFYVRPPDPSDPADPEDIFVSPPATPTPASDEETPEPTSGNGSGTPVRTPTPGPGVTQAPTTTSGATKTPKPNVTPPPTPVVTPTPSPPPTASPTPQSVTVTVGSMMDTYVSQLLPGTNFGTATVMQVGALERSLILFDLSSVPVGADVEHAEVRLCALAVAVGAAGRTHEIGQVGSFWHEMTATWNNFPSGNPGSNEEFTVPFVNGCVVVNVTDMIDDLAQGGSNWGMKITDEDEGSALLVQYATREDPTPSRRPTLTVVYKTP
jgi:hypothetical protein